MADTIDSTVKAALENVNSVATKGSESVTQMEKTCRDTVGSFQTQTTSLLESLNTQLAEMRGNFEIGQRKLQETVATATAESTKKVDELTSRAIDAGKRLIQLDTMYNQYLPYLELSYLSDKQYFPSITPRLLSTVRVVVRGFVQWLETSPVSVRYHLVIANSGRKLLQDLNAEVPDV